jgi:hypothetical protein
MRIRAAILILTNSISISRSQAPAWERTCRGSSPASRDGRRTEAGASGADAFPSWGLGTRKIMKQNGFPDAFLIAE